MLSLAYALLPIAPGAACGHLAGLVEDAIRRAMPPGGERIGP